MADVLNSSTEKLRKKSQILLAKVNEDSKRVDIEVKKLRLQRLSLVNYHKHKSQGDHVDKNTGSWKLRNDSSEVSAVLCPDYYRSSLRRTTASAPNMTSSAKLMLTSKKRCVKTIPRKPVKECYCYPEVNKTNLRSFKIQRRTTSPCCQCRSQFELKPVEETQDRVDLISPVSCETYRRVRKIDYTPRSQFLRNVQNRLCETWQSGGQGDCSRTCPRSSSYHKIMASAGVPNVESDRKTMLSEEVKCIEEQTSPAIPKTPVNSIASESGRDNVICSSNQTSSRRRPKSTLRKTISSKRSTSRSPTRSGQLYNCHCCRDEPGNTARLVGDNKREKKYSPRYHERRIRRTYSRCDGGPVADNASIVDQEVRDLRRFREQNYFETHGSSHTLASSRSSGSLEQYLLNERLFPEPVGKIHRHDLVVTMPPCATTEKKRIHYFPRYVVRQEKSVYNTNYKRKRHQSCPLTGHAIDLGILKTRPPLNSLALKYQKRNNKLADSQMYNQT